MAKPPLAVTARVADNTIDLLPLNDRAMFKASSCWSCRSPLAQLQCSACGVALYCSPECQARDWYAGHMTGCRGGSVSPIQSGPSGGMASPVALPTKGSGGSGAVGSGGSTSDVVSGRSTASNTVSSGGLGGVVPGTWSGVGVDQATVGTVKPRAAPSMPSRASWTEPSTVDPVKPSSGGTGVSGWDMPVSAAVSTPAMTAGTKAMMHGRLLSVLRERGASKGLSVSELVQLLHKKFLMAVTANDVASVLDADPAVTLVSGRYHPCVR